MTLDLGTERTPFNSFDGAKFFLLDGYSLIIKACGSTRMGPQVFGGNQNFSDSKERKGCSQLYNSFIQWVLVEEGGEKSKS